MPKIEVELDSDLNDRLSNFVIKSRGAYLQPGIYVAKLRLVNNETEMVGTIKLSVQK